MSFLSPWFLLGMLAVAVPIALHLLARERTTDVRLPTWQFLDQAPVEQTRRRRIADLLLLILRGAAVVLLALLFARPFLPVFEDEPLLVVAVDTSASMSAPATWAAARAAVEQRLSARSRGAEVALVSFDHGVRTVVEAASDAPAILRAFDALAPTGGRSSLDAVVGFVATSWSAERVTLVVVSDLQRDAIEPRPVARPSTMDVEIVPVAGATRNVWVQEVRRRGDGLDVLLGHAGDVATPVSVAVEVDGRAVSRAPVDLVAGSLASVPLRVSLPTSGIAVARVDDPVGIAADNARALVLDAPRSLPVSLIVQRQGGAAARYIREALASAPADTAFSVREVESGSPARVREALAGSGAGSVVIVASTRGLDRGLADDFRAVRARGGGVLGVAGPAVDVPILLDALALGGRVRFAGIGETRVSLLPDDVRHPVLAAFGPLVENLTRVEAQRWAEMVPGDDTRVVARLSNGRPALIEMPSDPGRLMLLATDLGRAWNEFPVEPVFVPFVIEMVRYLAHRRDAPPSLTIADAGVTATAVPGVVQLGHPPRRVAVNGDPRESILEFDTADAVRARLAPGDPAALASVRSQATEGGQRLWRYVLLGLVLVLAAEAWLAGGRGPNHVEPARGRGRSTQPAGGTS